MAQNKLRPIPTQRAILKMLKIYGKPNIDTKKPRKITRRRKDILKHLFFLNLQLYIYPLINISSTDFKKK